MSPPRILWHRAYLRVVRDEPRDTTDLWREYKAAERVMLRRDLWTAGAVVALALVAMAIGSMLIGK